MAEAERKFELIARLDGARSSLTRVTRGLNRRVEDLAAAPGEFRASIASHRGLWIGGAAAVGLLAAFRFRGKRKKARRAKANSLGAVESQANTAAGFALSGLVFAVARFLLNAFQPVLTKFVRDFAVQQFSKRF